MAATYLLHIARDNPFLDGNKRAGLATALAFLWLNGQRLDAADEELTAMVMGVAEGRSTPTLTGGMKVRGGASASSGSPGREARPGSRCAGASARPEPPA
jgi:hypothetical protein